MYGYKLLLPCKKLVIIVQNKGAAPRHLEIGLPRDKDGEQASNPDNARAMKISYQTVRLSMGYELLIAALHILVDKMLVRVQSTMRKTVT